MTLEPICSVGAVLHFRWLQPKAHVQGRVNQVRCVVDEVALEPVFARVLLFPPANHHSTTAPYSSITAPRAVRYP
jgi:hypothetical protein